MAVLRYTPERVWMRMDAVGPALLVAAGGYHSAWHATIDGRERASTVSGSRHARSTAPGFVGDHGIPTIESRIGTCKDPLHLRGQCSEHAFQVPRDLRSGGAVFEERALELSGTPMRPKSHFIIMRSKYFIDVRR